jgi:nicotinamidase-related amidase
MVLPNTKRLLEQFREQDRPVVFAIFGGKKGDLSDLPARALRQHLEWSGQGLPSPYAPIGDDRGEVLEDLGPKADEHIIRKVTFSAFRGTDLHDRLRADRVDTLVFVGVGTNYCVMLSLLEGYELGYRCVIVQDATATLSEREQRVAEEFVAPYASVMTTPEALGWLREQSGVQKEGAEL